MRGHQPIGLLSFIVAHQQPADPGSGQGGYLRRALLPLLGPLPLLDRRLLQVSLTCATRAASNFQLSGSAFLPLSFARMTVAAPCTSAQSTAFAATPETSRSASPLKRPQDLQSSRQNSAT